MFMMMMMMMMMMITANRKQRFLNSFISTDALHVSGGSAAHH
jgi:hypothetical protein